jgi:hypothetical protein
MKEIHCTASENTEKAKEMQTKHSLSFSFAQTVHVPGNILDKVSELWQDYKISLILKGKRGKTELEFLKCRPASMVDHLKKILTKP